MSADPVSVQVAAGDSNEPFSPELAAQGRGSAWWCGKEWVRSGCGAHEGRTALHCLEPSRVITPILASPGTFLVRKAQCICVIILCRWRSTTSS